MARQTKGNQKSNNRAREASTLTLDDVRPCDEPLVGPKAAGLVRMRRAGLPVPDAFCIVSSAYREHLDINGVFIRIESALAKIASGKFDGAARRSALAGIRQQIIDAPLSADLAGQIEASLSALREGPVAVRSSATAEDLPGHSFAGQHGTYFVAGLDACLLHVKHCWASLWTERAFDYRATHGFYHTAVEMAVVVQSLVDADASGVLFTADPVTGSRDRLVLEACFGLGEALVAGKLTPDRYVLARDGLQVLEERIADKTIEVLLTTHGVIKEREVDLDRAATPAIDEVTARRVAELSLDAEKIFDAPLDIEWAVRSNRVFMLQARPITTLETARPDRTIWSNANAGEVLPDVVCPMTWSLCRPLVDAIFRTIFGKLGLDLGGYELIDRIAGRVYFNVTVLAAAVRVLPTFGKMDVDELLGGMQAHTSNKSRLTIAEEDMPDLDYAFARRVLVRMPAFTAWWMAHSPMRSPLLIAEIRRRTESALAIDLEAAPEEAVAERLGTLSRGIYKLPDAIGFALVGFMHYSNLSAICRRWLGDEDGSITSRLLSGLGNMASANAGLDLWRVAVAAHDCRDVREAIASGTSFDEVRSRVQRVAGGRAFLDAWGTFMRDHGHHTRGELDVANPRWSEQPDYVLDMVRGYLRDYGKNDPLAVHKQRKVERETLTEECRSRLRNPFKRALFGYVLRRTQLGSVARENVKSEGVRYMATMRALLLALGTRLTEREVLDRPDDIFFLYLGEIEPVRLGTANFDAKATVAARREEFERDLRLTPPPVIIGRFDPSGCPTPEEPAADVLSGLAVSAGVVSGPARVILRADTDQQVLPGEILVAPFTDPGWTPYFMPAAGIVMDMGGMLSHGSICAREYGIPAVANVGPATKTIKTGQMLQVDGIKGQVRVLR